MILNAVRRAKLGSICLGVILSSFLPLDLPARPSFSIRDLGTLGGTYSFARGVNNSGVTTGDGETTNHLDHGILFQSDTNVDLSTITFAPLFSSGNAINSSNACVGQGLINGSTRAILVSGSVHTNLGTLGGDYSVAYGINDAGHIVGESTISMVTDTVHAFLKTNSTLHDIGTLGGDYSSARWINKFEHIVGESTTASNRTHAFLYNAGTMTDIGTLGGNESTARAINDSDMIVGYSSTTNGASHAFRYSGGTMIDLGALSGNESSANAVNNSGQIVGYVILTTPTTTNSHGFYFDGTTMYDLNDLIPTGSGWSEITSADGINDRGQITGYGTINGETHAYLATPAATFVNPRHLANGNFAFTLQAVTGNYLVESSSNLVNWASIITLTNTSSSISFTDNAASLLPRCFYRASTSSK